MTHPFNEDYFLRGKQTGVSNYENYSWMPEITKQCAEAMAAYLGMKMGDLVLDYGCARGFYCLALSEMGFRTHGYDISEWAILNCHPEVKSMVSNNLPSILRFDWIISKDTMEHIPSNLLGEILQWMMNNVSEGILLIVPLADYTGRYISERDREDKTHVTAWPLPTWLDQIQYVIDQKKLPFVVMAGYKCPGVKQAAPEHHSTAFITIRRFKL